MYICFIYYLRNVGNRLHKKHRFCFFVFLFWEDLIQIGHFGVILWKTRHEQIENPPGGWTSPSKISIEVSSWKRYEKVILFYSLPSPLESSLGRIPRNAQVPLVTRRLPSNQVGVGEMMWWEACSDTCQSVFPRLAEIEWNWIRQSSKLPYIFWNPRCGCCVDIQ